MHSKRAARGWALDLPAAPAACRVGSPTLPSALATRLRRWPSACLPYAAFLRGPSAKLGLLPALCALSSEHMASSATPGGPAARELVLRQKGLVQPHQSERWCAALVVSTNAQAPHACHMQWYER